MYVFHVIEPFFCRCKIISPVDLRKSRKSRLYKQAFFKSFHDFSELFVKHRSLGTGPDKAPE